MIDLRFFKKLLKVKKKKKKMVFHVVLMQHGLHGSYADFEPLEAAVKCRHDQLPGQLIVVNVTVSLVSSQPATSFPSTLPI